jgi:hypothetical protein
MDTKDTTAMSEWTPKPIDPDWKTKLTPQECAMLTISEASESFLNKMIRMFRDFTLQEFPNASVGYILDSKGRNHVAVAVYDWKMEVSPKNQITRVSAAPQMLGRSFRWSQDDDLRGKLRAICECWLSAFSRTKLSDEWHQAILSGQTFEDICAANYHKSI